MLRESLKVIIMTHMQCQFCIEELQGTVIVGRVGRNSGELRRLRWEKVNSINSGNVL